MRTIPMMILALIFSAYAHAEDAKFRFGIGAGQATIEADDVEAAFEMNGATITRAPAAA